MSSSTSNLESVAPYAGKSLVSVGNGDKINISAITIEAKEGLFEGSIKVYVHDKEELDELVSRLKQLNGIHSVDRFDTEVTEPAK
jgi:(p)ppGpp synthase/HD superfamily hydrolase